MHRLMRCLYCGWLQDEPAGVKACDRCGGELAFEAAQPANDHNYVQAQMELDQITAPVGKLVERHLIVTVHTPKQAPAAESAPAATGRKPLGFTIVLDVSGSMQGAKIDWAKKAVQQAIQHLHDGDLAALVKFSSTVETVLPPTRVDASLRQRLQSFLGDLNAGGQTALCGGLETGIAAAKEQPQDTNLVLLLSDGQANVGEIDLEKVGARALEASQNRIMVSTLGVGTDYNEALMSEIATQGGGRFYHLEHAHQIAPYVAGELGEASALLAREVVLRLQLPPNTGVDTFSAAYPVQDAVHIKLPDIPADTSLEIAIQVRLPPQGAETQLKIEGSLVYTSPANHRLEASLNPVTIRYITEQQFGVRDGVVAPVAHRILEQMRAQGIVRTNRAAGQGLADQLIRETKDSVSAVTHYASLLGEETARVVAEEYQGVLDQMQAAPAAAKAAMHGAHRVQRANKKFS